MNGVDPDVGVASRCPLIGWAARLFVRLAPAASLLLILIMVASGIAEIGSTGIALFAIAAAIVLGHGLRLAGPTIVTAMRRIRLRFSLRTLLVMTVITGFGLAWIGNKVRDVRQQRALVDRAYDHGFVVGFDDSLPGWLYDYFGINGALAWGDLEVVSKSSNRPFCDDDLEVLHGLRYQWLHLSFSQVSEDHIARWRPPPGLRCFEAQGTALGDKTAQHISHRLSLEAVELNGTNVTDAGVAHLATLPNLYLLGLEKTSITDDSVERLKKLKQLRVLRIWQTGITPEGAEQLREALPNCVILDDRGQITEENYYYWPERK